MESEILDDFDLSYISQAHIAQPFSSSSILIWTCWKSAWDKICNDLKIILQSSVQNLEF